MNVHSRQSGYVGLLALLITAAIIGLLVWRSYLFGTSTSSEAKGQNVIEQDMRAIDAAKDIKTKLEQSSQQSVEE